MSKKVKQQKTVEELLEDSLIPSDLHPKRLRENWVWVKLGSICEVNMGQSPKGEYTSEDTKGKPLIGGPADMGDIYPNANRYTSKPTKLSKIGELIVSVRATLGKTNISNGEYCLGRGVAGISSKIIDEKLLRYFFETAKDHLYQVSTGTTFSQISRKDIENLPFPLAPANEQASILHKLERLLNKIDEAKQLIDEAKQTFELRRAAILDKAFRGELTAKWREDNNVGFYCEGKKLGELIEIGPQNGLYKPKSSYGEGTLIVRIDNFYNGWINDWGTLKRLKLDGKEIELYGLRENDIIINRVNSIEYLGKSALVRNLTEPSVFESNVMRLRLNKTVVPEFLVLYLNSSRGLQELRKNAKHAVNQASINQQDVKNVIVPLPKREEQMEVTRIINTALKKEERAKKIVSLTEEINSLKASILFKAFRGELGTNDPIEESAIELLKDVLQEQRK